MNNSEPSDDPSARTPSASEPARSPRILIIEDEAALAEPLRYVLSTEGFDPVVCPNGQSGLRAFAADGAALVLLDIGLPDGSGFDVFHDLQRIRPVPVIYMTARTSEVDRVAGLEQGADDYISKPFSPREVVARVRSVLRRVRRCPETPAAEGPFQVNVERSTIQFFGRELALTPFEFRLLRLFVGRRGRVYSREDILERVWQDDLEVSERVVDAHIKALRAKLRAVRPGPNPIETHWGRGYALRRDW
jgi:two-component system catabolic regulation response regulator CreB